MKGLVSENPSVVNMLNFVQKYVRLKEDFRSGYKHKLNYYMRTAPNISNLLRHIDKVITKEFIPAVTGGAKCSENERM